MKQKMTIDKTLLIDFKGVKHPVSSLPESIQMEVETLDRLKQDLIDAAYAMETFQLAANMKALMINKMLEQAFTEPAQIINNAQETTNSANDGA